MSSSLSSPPPPPPAPAVQTRSDPPRPHRRRSLHPFFSVVTIDNHASLDSRSLPESSLATSTAAHRQPRPPGQALCAVRPQQLQPPSSLTLPGPDAMDVSRSNEQNTTPPPPTATHPQSYLSCVVAKCVCVLRHWLETAVCNAGRYQSTLHMPPPPGRLLTRIKVLKWGG